ncbi:60S ribosomal export protein NMD3 [Candidatus Micrarchaeota archaeon]|nr:60S ribosomal export protein NMD3 [Candidatus Micrarchaeota archaeon]MBU2476588.1 60S ribosomal export protein NMD3 [Candidatus Micrarchaeota archaeon]
MSFKFCPKCGSKKGPFIKGFCKDCFLQDNKLIDFSERIELPYCKRCNKIKLQRIWAEQNSLELIDFLKTKIKSKDFQIQEIEIELEEAREKKFNALITAKGIFEDAPLIVHGIIKIILVSSICDSCMKISSDYFEAIVQLRFEEETKKEKILNEFRKLISEMQSNDPLSRIVKLKKLKNGFDLVLSSNRAAKISSEKIAKKYFSRVTRSFSLVGVTKTGKEKKRHTYCVRI